MRNVILSASWCGPCFVLKKRLISENIEVEILDIDEEEGKVLAIKYQVKTVPTLLSISDSGGVENAGECFATRGGDDIIAQLKKKNV